MLDQVGLLTQTAPVAHPGFRLKQSEIKDLTPSVLKDFRSIDSSVMEREVNRRRVKHLREKADTNRLVTFHWVTVLLNGTRIRLNGQHSSTMLSEMLAEDKFPEGAKVHLEEYEADDGQAAALLFQQFDDPKSARSGSDVAGVYQGLQPDLADVDKDAAKRAIDGYVWFMRQAEGLKNIPVGFMSYTLFGDAALHPFIHWWNELSNSKTPELQHVSVIAAVWGTFLKNESEARVFWEQTARAQDPDDNSIPAVLDRWLLAAHDRNLDEQPKTAELFQGCIYAWNAARDNRQVSTIKSEIRKNLFAIRE